MIEIVPYQSTWPHEFQEIAHALRSGIGPLAQRIDHIGSTAVPGLAAKNIIDIQVSVTAFSDELLQRFSNLGYSRSDVINSDDRPPGDDSPPSAWQKWFLRPPAGQRPTNTHVRLVGNPNQRYPLLFRDYLRTHPTTAAAYADLKRHLAKELRDDSLYPDVKGPAVHLIYLAAIDWAARSGWELGPADA